MSAAESEPTNVPDHFEPESVRVAHTLVDLFGIERARKIAFQASSYLSEKYGDSE